MGIGGALAKARTAAGLTVTQVSERTRIRETIIRDIERDDYAACGGDYYARGHIRAIAHVVGADPVPLIEEYDAAHQPPPTLAELSAADPAPGWHLPGWHRQAPGAPATAYDHQNGNAAASAPVSRNGAEPRPLRATGATTPMHIDAAADDTDPGLSLTATDTRTLAQPPLDEPASDNGVADGTSAPTGAPDPRREQARAAGASALESASRWATAAKSRLARPPEPEGGGVPGGITAAEAFRPAMPLQPRRTSRRTGLVVVLLLVVIGLLIYFLVSGGSPSGHHPGTSGHASRHGSTTATGSHHSTHGSASPSASPSASASSPASAALAPLTVASATAFGPSGAGQGDNPSEASLAIDGSHSTAWHTDWYTTSTFSGMQSGTGLLLSLARSQNVGQVKMLLGSAAGGTIQLRAGNSPTLAALQTVASVPDSGGSLTVKLTSPVPARYVLIWFTSLPPDSSGTYQASIYNVSLAGTS